MGNCDSCVGLRERRRSSFDDAPIQKAPVNEIQYASGGNSPNMVNNRIVPFDRKPSIKIPPGIEKPPRKHRGI